MHRLYSLALLLTGEHKVAEECFQLALKQCIEGADVFCGWEEAWSRRAIVKQAIQMVRPKPGDSDAALTAGLVHQEDTPSRLLALQPFERFVFAMTVLEGYAVRETAALLNTVPSEVTRTRMRVLEALGPDSPARPPEQQVWGGSAAASLGATA